MIIHKQKVVTKQDLLDITADEFRDCSYFDAQMVVQIWDEAGRIKSLPDNIDDVYNGVDPYSKEGFDLFKSWLKEQGATYYAACKEDFFLTHGVQKALDEGNTIVYAENMS